VLEGRKGFRHILKYIEWAPSSNFGNMFSVIGASAWFRMSRWPPSGAHQQPALRLSQVPIPDRQRRPADDRQAPAVEHREITKFIVFIGPISSFSTTPPTPDVVIFKCSHLTCPRRRSLPARFAGVTDPDKTYAAALFIPAGLSNRS